MTPATLATRQPWQPDQPGSWAARQRGSSWAIGAIGQPPGCPRIIQLPLFQDRAVWFDLYAARKKTIIVRHFRIAPSNTKLLVTERPRSVPHRNTSTCTASGSNPNIVSVLSHSPILPIFLRHNDLVLVKPCVPSRPSGNEDMDMGADATWIPVDGRTDVHPESFKHCAERRKPFQTLLPRTLNFALTLQVTTGSMDSPKCHVRAAGQLCNQSIDQDSRRHKQHRHTHTPLHTTIPHTSGPNLENAGQHLRRRSTRSCSHSNRRVFGSLGHRPGEPVDNRGAHDGSGGRDLQRSAKFQTTLFAKFAKKKNRAASCRKTDHRQILKSPQRCCPSQLGFRSLVHLGARIHVQHHALVR